MSGPQIDISELIIIYFLIDQISNLSFQLKRLKKVLEELRLSIFYLFQEDNKYQQNEQVSKLVIMKLLKLLAVLIVLGLANAKEVPPVGCLGHDGRPVDWFVIITTPGSIHKSNPEVGYLYLDSKFKNHSFAIKTGYGNEPGNPIHRTILQDNKTRLLSAVWNDQLVQEQGSSNTHDAHSKSYLVMSQSLESGYFMDHSVPKYPFIEEGKIQPQIRQGQRIMGQHHFCISIDRKEIAQKIFENVCFMNPNMYHNDLFPKMFEVQWQRYQISYLDIVKFYDFDIGKNKFKTIYRNGYDQKGKKDPPVGSIFQYGLIKSLESSIIVQSYHGAKQTDCSQRYYVGRVNSINITKSVSKKLVQEVSWTSGKDHCKWAYALDNDFSCFGDLNRDTIRQSMRGGAFYCIQSPNLNAALKAITPKQMSATIDSKYSFIQFQTFSKYQSHAVISCLSLLYSNMLFDDRLRNHFLSKESSECLSQSSAFSIF